MAIVDRVALGEKEVQVSGGIGRLPKLQPPPSPDTPVGTAGFLHEN